QLSELRDLDAAWRTLRVRVEELRAKKNQTNEKISIASPAERETFIQNMQRLSIEEKQLNAKLDHAEAERLAAWRNIPNFIQDDVPRGAEKDFEVISTHSQPRKMTFPLKDYLELLGGDIDLARAAKVSGSRFVYIKNQLARLEIGLVAFLFDMLADSGFTPIFPPVLVHEKAMAGMGYLDQAGDEIYHTQDDLYLVGTSEQSVGPMHMDEVLQDADLPLRYVAFSSCFRREAGSHGKDVKGILRLHQFDKVEMFSFTKAASSEEEHRFLLSQQQRIMDALELPYRVIKLATGDLGFPAAKTYDIETWIPSLRTYRETHSTSNTTDYQAHRLNIRSQGPDGTQFVHMLNATALAMSRIFIALLENHQQEGGSVRLPHALHPYLPFSSIVPAPKE
ncbi:MAG: serine--tRNA ligase, partial [Acidobacteriota bacterium]